jgi:hypothetical protein
VPEKLTDSGQIHALLPGVTALFFGLSPEFLQQPDRRPVNVAGCLEPRWPFADHASANSAITTFALVHGVHDPEGRHVAVRDLARDERAE